MEHNTSMPNMGRRLSLQAFHALCSKREEQLSSFVKPTDGVKSPRRNALFITSPDVLLNIPLQLKSAPPTPRKPKSESNCANPEMCARNARLSTYEESRYSSERHKRNASVQSNASWTSIFTEQSSGAAPPSTPESSVFAGNADDEPKRKDSVPKEEVIQGTMRWLLADDHTA
jgi:hypothetical protein